VDVGIAVGIRDGHRVGAAEGFVGAAVGSVTGARLDEAPVDNDTVKLPLMSLAHAPFTGKNVK
jgi:hypothetical protein